MTNSGGGELVPRVPPVIYAHGCAMHTMIRQNTPGTGFAAARITNAVTVSSQPCGILRVFQSAVTARQEFSFVGSY